MHRCLELASSGSGKVSPNPLVGAILVHNDEIIGEGFHESYGSSHAEVNAIKSVQEKNKHRISAATLYVNLEPCNHFGKTPPCTKLILEHEIKKVIVGCLDPNPLVSAQGISELMQNGVEVQSGILEEECRTLNNFFITYHEKQRPYITLKWAESRDGYIAAEQNKTIHLTNQFSDSYIHKMRSEYQSIFAGMNTILHDNPKLTTRKWNGNNPIRITADMRNQLAAGFHILDGETQTIIFNSKIDKEEKNIKWIKINGENLYFEIMQQLFLLHINSVLVEGGAKTIMHLTNLKLWDDAYIFKTKHKLNSGISAPEFEYQIHSNEFIFDDELTIVKPR